MRRRLDLELEPDPDENATARRVIRSALALNHAREEQTDHAVLVTSKLFPNAVRASSDEASLLGSVVLTERRIALSVAGYSDAFEAPTTASTTRWESGLSPSPMTRVPRPS